jgi:hypothetical protein
MVSSYLRWRWTEYITGIMMMFFLLLDVLILDESYPPILLVNKARRLRHETGNWALHARHEEWDVSLKELAHKFMLTPFRLLATPICFLVALYASFVYGILYLYVFPLHLTLTTSDIIQVFGCNPNSIRRGAALGTCHFRTAIPCNAARNNMWRICQYLVRSPSHLSQASLTVLVTTNSISSDSRQTTTKRSPKPASHL